MSHSIGAWTVLLVALVAANLPFMNERLLVVGPKRSPKSLGWRVLELVVLLGLTLGFGVLVESQVGQRQPQGWEFYAATACLFLTLAFPGFVWRYLRRQR